MVRFKLDVRKAIEATAILARLSPGGRIGTKRLLALLYIASRECLKRSGRPLLGGRLVAMKYGPIHGDLYNLIKQKEGVEGVEEWRQRFDNEGYFVVLGDDPGVNALSRFEAKLLADTLKRYENEDDWDVADKTHEFAEYTTTYCQGKPPRAIPLAKVIHSVGLGPLAASIENDLKKKETLDALFAEAEKSVSKKP